MENSGESVSKEEPTSFGISSTILPDLPVFVPFVPSSSSSLDTTTMPDVSPVAAADSAPVVDAAPVADSSPVVDAAPVADSSHVVDAAHVTDSTTTEAPTVTVDLPLPMPMQDEEPVPACDPSLKPKTFIDKINSIYEKLKKDPDSVAFIKANPTFLKVFGMLLEKNPILFLEFESKINLILEDGKLSVKDIPNIIELLNHVYFAIKSLKPKSVSADVYSQIAIDIVYSIFVICENQGIIKLNQPKETITHFLLILESCRDLIKLSIEYKKWWMICGC